MLQGRDAQDQIKSSIPVGQGADVGLSHPEARNLSRYEVDSVKLWDAESRHRGRINRQRPRRAHIQNTTLTSVSRDDPRNFYHPLSHAGGRRGVDVLLPTIRIQLLQLQVNQRELVVGLGVQMSRRSSPHQLANAGSCALGQQAPDDRPQQPGWVQRALVRMALEEQTQAGQHDDLQVQGKGPVLDVVDVVQGAIGDWRGAAEVVDLRPPREAWPHPLPLQVARNLSAVPLVEERRLRTRSYQAHVSTKHVEKLRQLVQAAAPHDPAKPGHAGIPWRGDDRSGLCLSLRDHRSELEDHERLAVAAYALLSEEDGSRHRQLDQDHDREKDRAEDDEQDHGDHDVDRPLDEGRAATQLVAPDAHQRQAVDRIGVHPGAHDLEQVGHDLELEVLILALFDQMKQAIALGGGQG